MPASLDRRGCGGGGVGCLRAEVGAGARIQQADELRVKRLRLRLRAESLELPTEIAEQRRDRD